MSSAHQKLPGPQRSQGQNRALPTPAAAAPTNNGADDVVLFDANSMVDDPFVDDDLGDSYDAIAWTTPGVTDEEQYVDDVEPAGVSATTAAAPAAVIPTQRALPATRSLPTPKQQSPGWRVGKVDFS
jgi:hypothetical protein